MPLLEPLALVVPPYVRPLSELSMAALASVVGVACDLDGTLTAHGALTSVSLRALESLAQAGIPCVLVTGRPLGWGEVLGRLLPVRAVVTENGGAWVVRENSCLRLAFLESEPVRTAGMARVQRLVDHLVQTLPPLQRVRDLTLRATDVALDIHESTDVPEETVQRAEALARAHGLYTTVSSIHLHVSARPPDKFAGLQAAVADLGLDPALLRSRWLYVGDSPNDAGPFAAMDLSIGVANVRDHKDRMTAWPRYMTEQEAGAGFAEVVSRLLAARNNGGGET